MSQIVTLYSDKERTDALYPRTKVSAISDDSNTPLKELMTGMVKQEEGGAEEEVVTPINADTLGGKLTADNVVFYEEEIVDEVGQVVVRNADKLENHPASYFATSEELKTNSEDLNTKANKSDVLSLEEIQASTDLTDKIASASALKNISRRYYVNIGAKSSATIDISDLDRNREYLILYTTDNGTYISGGVLLSTSTSNPWVTHLSDKVASSFSFSLNYPTITIQNNEAYDFPAYITIIG